MIIGYRPVKKKTLKTVHFASLQTRHTKNAHIYVALVVAELFDLSFSCSERGIEPLNNRHQRRPSLQKMYLSPILMFPYILGFFLCSMPNDVILFLMIEL